jgi:Zn-finger nucleic acid-binding protein
MEMIMEKPEAVGLLCPTCRVDIVMSERQGVEIDYCPKCRGLWLDRGELDKIVERSVADAKAAAPSAPASFLPRVEGAQGPWDSRVSRDEAHYEQGHRHLEDSDDRHHDGRHRRESFFERLFD